MDLVNSISSYAIGYPAAVLKPLVINVRLRRILLAFLGFILLFYSYQSLVSVPSMTLLGKKELKWNQSKYCREILISGSRFTGYDSRNSSLPNLNRVSCESNWFSIVADSTLHLYYNGDLNKDTRARNIVIVRNKNGEILRKPLIPQVSNGWIRRFEVKVKQDELVQVELYTEGSNINYSMLLNQVDVWQSSGSFSNLSNYLESTWIKIILSLLISCVIVYAYEKIVSTGFDNSLAFAIFFTLIAFVIQFRKDVFFHADEWIFLHQIKNGGVLLRHNEHFVPLAGLIYKIESLLFGMRYEYFVAVSTILIAINAWLLSLWIRRVFTDFIPKNVEWILGLLYLVNISHTETVQWALCQGSLLSVAFSLRAGISLAKYYRSRKVTNLIDIVVCFACTAYSFTLGFTIFGFLLLQWAVHSVLEKNNFSKKHSFLLLTSLIITLVVLLAIRNVNKDGFMFEEATRSQFATLKQFKNFVLSGTFFGTILRGSGLFPVAEVQRMYFLADEYTLKGFYDFRMKLAYIGFAIYFVLASISFVVFKNRKNKFILASLVLGSSWLFIPMFITAYGRSNFGDDNALAFRYQAYPILGLFLLLIPVISFFYRIQNGHRLILGRCLILTLVALQIHSHFTFTHYFSNMGAEFRLFNQTYCKWKASKKEESKPLIYSPFHESMMDLSSYAVNYESLVNCQ